MVERRICLGVIAGAHGIKGLVRVKSFTERPEDLTAYGSLSDEAGARAYALTLKGRVKGVMLAAVDGVTDRNQAEALKGTRLFVEREALPATEDEEVFYHADLIGLAVEDRAGQALGRVAAVHNHGAGDLLEIAPEGGTADGALLLLPFTAAAVPLVDLAAGRLVALPPEEVVAQAEEGAEEEG